MFAYCRNNPIGLTDLNGNLDFQWDHKNSIIQIDLENKFEIDMICAGKAIDTIDAIEEIVKLGFVDCAAAEIPVVNVLAAYTSMLILTHDGLEIAMNISDINQLQNIYRAQGHAYLIWTKPDNLLDLMINGPCNFSVESKPLISKKNQRGRRRTSSKRSTRLSVRHHRMKYNRRIVRWSSMNAMRT